MSTNVESASTRPRRSHWIEDAERLDLAIYAAIARTLTPALDVAMSRLSRAADYSRLSLTSAVLLALTGGRTGRRAAAQGLASLAVTTTVANIAVKPLARRRRPDRLAGDVPLARHARMPLSRSFPSGHSELSFSATGPYPADADGPPGPAAETLGDNPAIAATGWSSPRWYEIDAVAASEA